MQSFEAASFSQLGVASIDLNGLKRINDQMGHHVGDQAIYTAARCIQIAFDRAGDCYRIGGDEFAVILTGENVSNKTMVAAWLTQAMTPSTQPKQ